MAYYKPIIGPSGTGKSTFLNLLNRLEEPDGGKIIFEGNDTIKKDYDLNKMRQKVGMVFQSFNLFSHLTIIENIMLAQTELLHRSRKEACEKGMELLGTVGLEDKALSLPSQLSGGQQQRIAQRKIIYDFRYKQKNRYYFSNVHPGSDLNDINISCQVSCRHYRWRHYKQIFGAGSIRRGLIVCAYDKHHNTICHIYSNGMPGALLCTNRSG